MTRLDWNTSTDPAAMLALIVDRTTSGRRRLQDRTSDRKLRLFAVACCYAVWDRLTDPRSRRAVEVAERHADGNTTPQERIDAINDAQDYGEVVVMDREQYAFASLATKVLLKNPLYWRDPTYNTLEACGVSHTTQCQIIRTIIGDPFNPVTLDPHCRTPDVLAIASRIYDTRDWDALPMLADALETAGCEDARVLEWLRETGRQCWQCGGKGTLLGCAGDKSNPDCDECSGTGRIKPARCRGDWAIDLVLGRE